MSPYRPIKSAEGIAFLVRWAKAHGFVLSQHHKEIAERFDINVEGVVFTEPLPTSVEQRAQR